MSGPTTGTVAGHPPGGRGRPETIPTGATVSAWFWLLAAVVFVVIEITNMAFFALFAAAGALAAAVVSAAGGPALLQVIVFAVAALVASWPCAGRCSPPSGTAGVERSNRGGRAGRPAGHRGRPGRPQRLGPVGCTPGARTGRPSPMTTTPVNQARWSRSSTSTRPGWWSPPRRRRPWGPATPQRSDVRRERREGVLHVRQ